MSAAFEEFMRQYKMTGSEKADGYSDDVFVGLEPDEKETVFKLLETELPWSAEWLFRLDPKKALVVVKELERKLRGDPDANVYMLQQKIVKHSGDLAYQKRMIEDYPHYANRLKPLVVSSIDNTPVNKAKINFFKEVIFQEVNASAVTRAARYLLDAVKIPRASESEKTAYDRLLGELRSDDLKAKQRAIAKVESYGNDLGATSHEGSMES